MTKATVTEHAFFGQTIIQIPAEQVEIKGVLQGTSLVAELAVCRNIGTADFHLDATLVLRSNDPALKDKRVELDIEEGDEEGRIEAAFEAILPHASRKTQPVDLSILHTVITNLSEEEKKRAGYIFEADHASLLEDLYRRWMAQVIADNITLHVAVSHPEDEPNAIQARLSFMRGGFEEYHLVFDNVNWNMEQDRAAFNAIVGVAQAA